MTTNNNVDVMPDKYSFEEWIFQCCKASEKDLRKFLKRRLTAAGFTIQEDNYKGPRDGEYSEIRNMIAIRGENPKVCLVAHTDVCRDHIAKGSSSSNSGGSLYSNSRWAEYDYSDGASGAEYEYVYNNEKKLLEYKGKEVKKEEPKKIERLVPTPVFKILKENNEERLIIQDKNKKVQVGGDDRLGVAINSWIALNSHYDMGLLFTTDEEIGLQSARKVEFPELKKFELLLQTDRGNKSKQLVNKISGQVLCDYLTAVRLLGVSYRIGDPLKIVTGYSTDVYAIRQQNRCKNAVNMTVGYHNSISSSGDEYIDVLEAREAMHFVYEVIKDYEMEDLFE